MKKKKKKKQFNKIWKNLQLIFSKTKIWKNMNSYLFIKLYVSIKHFRSIKEEERLGY